MTELRKAVVVKRQNARKNIVSALKTGANALNYANAATVKTLREAVLLSNT